MDDAVDPDELEAVELPVVRRGLDPEEVRSVLARAADGLRLAHRRVHDLEHQVETLEGQLPDGEEVERARDEARRLGRSEGEAEGDRRLAAARKEAESVLTDAKEEGRHLVQEAQSVRRRMLEDLARRRRALRRQIEQLRGGRERLLEAYEVVGHTMREATEELSAALPEARAAAERAGHRVGAEETVEELEAEIEAARLAGLPIVDDGLDERPLARPDSEEAVARRRPSPVPLERDVRDMPEVEPVLADFERVRLLEGEGAAGDEPAAADEGPAVAGDGDEDHEPEPAGESDGDAGSGPRPEAGPDAAAVEEGGPTEDTAAEDRGLFSRLREETVAAAPPSGSAEVIPDGTAADRPAGPDDEGGPEETPGPTDAGSGPVGPSDGGEDGAEDGPPGTPDRLDDPDDAAEPFGLALDAPTAEAADVESPRSTAEHELARRLKRLLSDEQNDVLDRLRRTRKRKLGVDDLLDDFDVRVTRFADAVRPVLEEAARSALGDDGPPVDDLAAELAREVAEALADGIVEPLEEERPLAELATPVRGLYRDWKTDRIGGLAERYVEAACEPEPESS